MHTKKHWVKLIRDCCHATHEQAATLLERIEVECRNELAASRDVLIPGLGKLHVADTAPKMSFGRQIPAGRKVRFRAVSELKEAIKK